MRNRLEKIAPIRNLVLVIIVFAFNCLVYWGARIFTKGASYHYMSCALDEIIPFCPFFSLFYLLAYAQWTFGFLTIAREERSFCDRYIYGELFAKFLCFLFFVFYPTSIARGQYEAIAASGTGPWNWLTNFFYSVDAPDNLFPSIHCLESYVCLRTSFLVKNVKHKKLYIALNVTACLLVFASTLFIKQHVVADVFGAIAVAEIGFAVSGLYFRIKKRREANG